MSVANDNDVHSPVQPRPNSNGEAKGGEKPKRE
jgi:hypothetical protein